MHLRPWPYPATVDYDTDDENEAPLTLYVVRLLRDATYQDFLRTMDTGTVRCFNLIVPGLQDSQRMLTLMGPHGKI